MLEDVLQNRQHILICIQYEVLQKKEVFEAYTSFCEILGDNAMEYSEFDFWFYYFLNGSFDLNYERKTDPKPLGLSDMPIEVAYKIVEKLNWNEKFIFRDVSKKCREVVDATPAIINVIDLSDSDGGTILTFDDHSFKYGKHNDDICVESDEEGTEYDEEEESDFEDEDGSDSDEEIGEKLEEEEREECEKRAVQTLATVLNNPRLQIGKLFFLITHKTLVNKLNALFQSLNHQLHVKSFEYYDNQGWYCEFPEEVDLIKFLSHFKPGTLECIKVYNWNSTARELASNIEQLAKLEQWNQAKRFETNYKTSDNIDKVAHFDRLSAHIDGNFKSEHVVYLKNIYLNSPTFKKCDLGAERWDTERIREALGNDRFPIADGSTLYVDVSEYFVTFTRE